MKLSNAPLNLHAYPRDVEARARYGLTAHDARAGVYVAASNRHRAGIIVAVHT